MEYTMELREFIQATLQQIVEGVSAAQKDTATAGAIINPSTIMFYQNGQYNKFDHAMPTQVEFDVGLATTDKKDSAEGIGVFLGSINLGTKNATGTENVAVTRVKFSVPIVLPPGASQKCSTPDLKS